ncbi:MULTISPECIES: hypothetical protein [Priestia]|uniref:hypothetical protein n=1 Tax=Priestia TaxID=2800373 RepID=UPI000E15E3F1|nr:hypothetical protein [Priestia megaterium]SUV01454.1 Uncharacterised protein [Priestia megaterium]
MNQDLSLKNHNSGLEIEYEKRRINSFELGKQAIDALLTEGKDVTLHNVSKKTKELDEQGIHFNTIRNHEKLYAYYKEKSKSYKKKQKEFEKHRPYRDNKKHTFREFRQLNPDRDLKNVYKQYMRLTKAELATRLIEAEQYIAKGNEEYLKKLFETYEG